MCWWRKEKKEGKHEICMKMCKNPRWPTLMDLCRYKQDGCQSYSGIKVHGVVGMEREAKWGWIVSREQNWCK